jgi:hypothetical protein
MDTNTNMNEIMSASQAFMDEDRLRIAGLLAVEPLTAAQVAERLSLHPAKVQRHLEVLGDMGLVKEQAGSYRLDVAGLNALSQRLLADRSKGKLDESFEGDEYDRKVLRDYMQSDGRLKQIPSQHKKLLVILRYLAGRFEPGVRYSEKDVNAMLKPVHDDTAALRRYLVDEGFLAREAGIYWRTESAPVEG